MAAVSRGEHSVLSVSSGESSGSRGSNNSSSDSQQSGSTLRVVGRGGSGSRLRQFDPKIQKPDPNIVRQEHRPPLVRHSGRGGLGSRPKPLAAPLVPPKDTPTPKPPGAETPILIRPSGRGGLASRPKPPGSASPSLLKLLSKRKVRVNKGKEKAPEERRAIHPIPPNQTYSISNASSSTLSTIHFIGEAGEPSIPFFPNDQSLDSNHSDAEKSNTSPSSMFSSDQSSSRTTILSDQPEDNDEHPNESRPTTPVDHRQRNISKLTRTLGDLPDDVLFKDITSRRPTGASPSRKNKNAKAFRRSGISMTSLGSMFSRSGGRARDSIATSTMTDDLHQFDLADDLSESWGNMNESSSSICRPPPSPIVFSPPSPLAGPNPKGPSVPNSSGLSGDASVAEQSTESDTLSCASSTLSRSTSFSIASSQRPSITSHNRSTSTSILSEGRLENNRSIWLIPIKDDDDDLEVGHIHRVNITDRPQNWSGEWNNDLHQVIKSLRLL
ncbi:hypothetical protein CVT25_008684 [Psilocybe cyanescens]|uniref:Uncharacterized protein n=1 Tax=Psilocybe cyanescens TaxID=93625 RepID=A0A409W0W0_PSICY|nr:hypothetical protein CVT25_008684 [Psilocybe cyanescens]